MDRHPKPDREEREPEHERAEEVHRPGQPEDCVGAYLFLASDALAGFITGATIDINGGAYLS